MQRILYNPVQTPAKATPEAVQAQAAGQGSRVQEPVSDQGAGDGLPDILDQLMADGVVQDVPPARAGGAVLHSAAGPALAL